MSTDFNNWPSTEEFKPVDTIGVPHPYCITPKHVAYASDRCGGMLGGEAIRGAEKFRHARCGVRGCNLSYDEHEQAVIVECKTWDKDDPDWQDRLREYLLSIKDRTEEHGFAGFAFRGAA